MRFFTITGLVAIVILLAGNSALAQISEGGTPYSFSHTLRTSRVNLSASVMETVDVAAFLAEDSSEMGKDIPYRFGAPFDVNYTPQNSGTWEELPDGSGLWRLKISSPGAYSINLLFDDFHIPENARLFIYNEDGSHVIGAFTRRNNKEHGQFATAPVRGDTIVLEYYEPADIRGLGNITISRVVHAYRNLFDFTVAKDIMEYGESGACNNNINCPEGEPWQDQKRSVAMIITSGGSRICTGALVNNARQDQAPLFLTANHCLGSEESWVFMFNYESPTCDNADGPDYYTVQGSDLLATYYTSDFALLELDEQPPDSYQVYFSGWSAVDIAPESSVCIHHPSGDIKKISFDYDSATATPYLGTSTGTSHWRIGQWEDGTTEPGSSGSPLFDQHQRIIGQLHGGYASCNNPTASDWYGRVAMSWEGGGTSDSRLKDWLDPDNTGILALDGFDPYAGTIIIHNPLGNTSDTLNDYEVVCTITTNATLITDSLLLYWRTSGNWIAETLISTGTPDEYHAFIPAQPAGTGIEYYLYAVDIAGVADTTDVYSFMVLDYGVDLIPGSSSLSAAVNDTTWYDLTAHNIGIFDDTYSLMPSGHIWPTTIWDASRMDEITTTGIITQGQSLSFSIRVVIPTSVFGDLDTARIIAISQTIPSLTDTAMLVTVSEGEPLQVPITEPFADPDLNSAIWVYNAGATVTSEAYADLSAPFSLNFDGNPVGADTVFTQAIDLEYETNVILTYLYNQGIAGEAPDDGDDLFLEYYNDMGHWAVLKQLAGSGSSMSGFEMVRLSLPSDAYHSTFRLRFHNLATVGNYDDWYIDEIYIGPPPDYDVAVTPSLQTNYGSSGDTVSFLLTIHNQGLYDDSYIFVDSGSIWDVGFFTADGMTQINTTGVIPPVDSEIIMIKVHIPETVIMNEGDTSIVKVISQGNALVYAIATIVPISAGSAGGFPWYEPFPDDTLSSVRWVSNVGATISPDGLNPPSMPYSLNLDGGNDTVVTQLIDLSEHSGAILAYYVQGGGGGETPDVGDYLRVDYRNAYGEWLSLNNHPGTGMIQSAFTNIVLALPADAMHGNFQLRFYSFGSCVDCDDWFIDDIRVDFAPEISVDPNRFDFVMNTGDSATDQLIIANNGPGGLIYSITALPQHDKITASMVMEPARHTYPDGFHDYIDEKGFDDPRVGIPVNKNAGGPDGTGYYWVDSDQSGGPTFAWYDISTLGAIVSGLDDDNYVGPFDLQFDFPFYDSSYNSLFIGSNGIIGFSASGMDSRFKTSLPSTATPNAILAWLWDDLDITNGNNPDANVYILSEASQCIVQFSGFPEYGAGAGDVVTTQVIIAEDGTIQYQYLSVDPEFDVTSCAVGIENPAGTDGLEVAYLTPYLKDSLAVEFYRPYRWLELDRLSGSLDSGEADTINLKITTAQLDSGTYEADLIITGNDPNPANNPVIVPVTLNVSSSSYVCGDANGDGDFNLLDVLYLIIYIYQTPPGPAPDPMESGDANADGDVNLLDILHMISNIYGNPPGPPPLCP
ncbi:MAG: trypsin-like peptidase domain-containing protein [candidate division Zixibacteria bacterium]|nr:trypsin-like peptidase domain-containing protein [candidate division Zixibacteria bacterium]